MSRSIRSLAIMTTLVLFVACTGRTPSSTVKGFYRAVNEGDADAAISLMSDQVKGVLTEDKFRAAFNEYALTIRGKGGISEVRILKEDVVGGVASVSTVVVYGNGQEESDTHKLIKERGLWRLQLEK